MKYIKLFEQFLNEAKAKPGPDPYMRGLSDKEEEKKKEKMKKQAEMDDDDPDAYKEMPGDKEAREKGEVKTSKHVTKYHQLYGDKDKKDESVINEEKAEGDRGPIDDEKIEKALKTKSEETGVPIEFLRLVMRRGMAAWKTGHRPGAGIQQWGYARVNAFLTKGEGTWGGADADIAKEVRDGGHDKDLKEGLEWNDSDAPDANGRFRDLSPKDLAAWLIKTRKGDMKKISGSLSQQVAFNKNEDPEYADKMDKTRIEVYKQMNREDLLESVLNEEETYNDYPAAAKKNAQMAIDWKEKYGRDEVEAGTAVGWARAHQLAKGENLSADTIGRMASFNRHRKNSTIAPELKDTPWLDKGYVSWLIWGGDEGVDWAIKKMEEISKTESNRNILFGFDEFVNEKKKSKPKSDKQKIQDLTKKQKGLVKKARDIQGEIKDLAKSDDRKPTDKLQGLLLQSQMQQSTVDAQKAAVQKQQIELKSKIKTAKQKEKATDKKG